MEVCVCLVNGKTFELTIADGEDTRTALASVSHAMFDRNIFQVHGATTSTMISSSSVEVVDFFTEMDPEWRLIGKLKSLVSLSRESFVNKVDDMRGEFEKLRSVSQPGDEVQGLAEVMFASGRIRYLHFVTELQHRLNQQAVMASLFEPNAIAARLEQGGHCVLNTANIAAWRFHPGPAEAPLAAWPGEPKTELIE
jgi:hypothetical protein